MKNAFAQFIQYNRVVQVVLFAALLGVAAIFLIRPAQATDARVITIFADGIERTINTGAENVGDALEKAQVKVNTHDLVEPTVDTPIHDAVYRINVYRARPVTIIDGSVAKTVVSPYQSARLIASEANIEVYPEDLFTLEQVVDIVSTGTVGQRLTIDRAKVVYLNLYGRKLTLRTQAETVEELLQEKSITLAKGETIKPNIQTAITENMSVFIAKVGTKIISEEAEVPFEEEVIQDSSLPAGTRVIKEPGTLGRKTVAYEVVLKNGIEVSRKKLHEVVTKQPTKQVVVVGTKVSDPRENVQIGQGLAAGMGWTGSEWGCLYQLWQEESGWNHTAANTSSGAYGIPQALPGNKMGTVSGDWASNPATQIQWGLGYIAGRYGTPCSAYSTKSNQGWY